MGIFFCFVLFCFFEKVILFSFVESTLKFLRGVLCVPGDYIRSSFELKQKTLREQEEEEEEIQLWKDLLLLAGNSLYPRLD